VAAAARLSSVGTLVEAVGLAKESNTYINTHFREHISDLDQGQLEALEQSGALTEVPLLLAHAVHLSDDDIARLDRPNVHVSHQPLSNMRLASGVIRLPSLATAEISVGLGLDGGTNDTSDMFMNMRAAVGLQRATTLNASVYPTPADVLRVATLGGATALGKQDQIGSLTPGKQADVLVLDPHTINWGPSWDWVGQIVYSAAPVNVKWVFVRGEALKARGKLNYPKSMAKLVSRAEAVAARLKLGISGIAEPY
jgi:5-methylthioadenosine/S-adenosylhomocysteine deaminase